MQADNAVRSATPPALAELALAALGALVAGSGERHPELDFLLRHRETVATHGEWDQALLDSLRTPAEPDRLLLDLAAGLGLSPFEILAVALAAAVEQDACVGRALARLQSPVASARPSLGLLAAAFGSALEAGASPWAALLDGPAVASGLLLLGNDSAPLPERSIAVPAPLCLALAGFPAHWPGVHASVTGGTVPLPPSTLTESHRQARALAATAGAALLLRCGSPSEGRAVAIALTQRLENEAVFVETDKLAGFGPWLRLCNRLPVFVLDLAPGERRLLPELPGYDGPVIALAGPDGAAETARGAMPEWTVGVPPAAERTALWESALGDGSAELARRLAADHRHGAGRIALVGRLARHHARLEAPDSGDTAPTRAAVAEAAWSGEGGGLDSLAEPLRAAVPDEAFVATESLRASLELLLLRCRTRDTLVDGLGAAATARYRPGVRALFTGPSGTGKTLAAGWLATRLGLPLYRVDLASVTSKYIGETEKNLARLLARAEQAEVVLLFDEADSLFGKRTDIRDSNDRFANAQTNYLLQRIESYDGLVLLTSNSKARFDSAFTRRLDVVLEFPLPGADERRALWLAHLGRSHALAPAELNRLAALADLAGGHIRNAVLTASLLARRDGRPVALSDCLRGLHEEYRKLGRNPPPALVSAPDRACP